MTYMTAVIVGLCFCFPALSLLVVVLSACVVAGDADERAAMIDTARDSSYNESV